MDNKISPLSLSRLRLTPYSPDSEVAVRNAALDYFDERHDFSLSLTQSALAVMMHFTSDRALRCPGSPGVRRSVAVSLVDHTRGIVMSTVSVRVNIPKGELTAMCRVDFPFACADVCVDSAYKVTVRDEGSGLLLGEQFFRMFDEARLGPDAGKWFDFGIGGVAADDVPDRMFRSVTVPCLSCWRVMFSMHPRFMVKSLTVPEMQVRLHLPHCRTEVFFVTPVCDEDEDYEYHVEVPFHVGMEDIGLCYAELLCLDYPVAGFVFSTNGPLTTGFFAGRELDCIEEYSEDAARRRFCRDFRLKYEPSLDDDDYEIEPSFADSGETSGDEPDDDGWDEAMAVDCGYDDDCDGDGDSLDAEDFDRLLDEFIASEKESISSADSAEAVDAETDDDADENSGEASADDACTCSMLPSLDSLTGLASVKAKLAVYEKVVLFNGMRLERGLPFASLPLHAMFLGSPGTGKTTVAKMMGVMLRRAGVLSKGHVVVRERATLMGPLYGDQEKKTLEALEEAQGGILLIDEAYQLYQPDDSRDPGRMVIETLMTALADESKRDWMLVLAGYPDRMRRMFEMNPGLRSRIPESNIYLFEDFTEPELMDIAERYLSRYDYTLTPEAREALTRRLAADYAARDETFGNARHVINLIQTDILPAMAVRVASSPSPQLADLKEIRPSDIPAPSPAAPSLRRQRIGFAC